MGQWDNIPSAPKSPSWDTIPKSNVLLVNEPEGGFNTPPPLKMPDANKMLKSGIGKAWDFATTSITGMKEPTIEEWSKNPSEAARRSGIVGMTTPLALGGEFLGVVGVAAKRLGMFGRGAEEVSKLGKVAKTSEEIPNIKLPEEEIKLPAKIGEEIPNNPLKPNKLKVKLNSDGTYTNMETGEVLPVKKNTEKLPNRFKINLGNTEASLDAPKKVVRTPKQIMDSLAPNTGNTELDSMIKRFREMENTRKAHWTKGFTDDEFEEFSNLVGNIRKHPAFPTELNNEWTEAGKIARDKGPKFEVGDKVRIKDDVDAAKIQNEAITNRNKLKLVNVNSGEMPNVRGPKSLKERIKDETGAIGNLSAPSPGPKGETARTLIRNLQGSLKSTYAGDSPTIEGLKELIAKDKDNIIINHIIPGRLKETVETLRDKAIWARKYLIHDNVPGQLEEMDTAATYFENLANEIESSTKDPLTLLYDTKKILSQKPEEFNLTLRKSLLERVKGETGSVNIPGKPKPRVRLNADGTYKVQFGEPPNIPPENQLSLGGGGDDGFGKGAPPPKDGDNFSWGNWWNNRSRKDKFFDVAADASRSIQVGFDLGWPLRQGRKVLGHSPKIWGSAVKEGAKGFKNEEYFNKAIKDMKVDPLFKIAEEHGLDFTDLASNSTKREEQYRSPLAENLGSLPKVGKALSPISSGVRASERAATLAGNVARFKIWKAMVQDPNVDKKAAADFVNTITGRSKLPGDSAQKGANLLNYAVYSPKMVYSNFKFLNPYTYYKAPKGVRKEYVKAALGMIGTTYAANKVAESLGADITWNPTSSDFGKIKIGNTHLDTGGGIFQNLVLLARMGINPKTLENFANGKFEVNQETTSGSGKTTKLDKGFGRSSFEVLADFGRSKASPLAGATINSVTGQDMVGNPTNPLKEVGKMYTPFLASDFIDVVKENPGLAPFITAISAAGGSQQTFKSKGSKGPFSVKMPKVKF